MKHLSLITLDSYLDNVLDAVERPVVESHLSACAICRAELDRQRVVFTLLPSLPEERIPHDLTTQIMADLTPNQVPALDFYPKVYLVRGLLFAQVALVFALLVWEILHNRVAEHMPSFSIPEVSLSSGLPSLDFKSFGFKEPTIISLTDSLRSGFSDPFWESLTRVTPLDFSPFLFALIVGGIFWLVCNYLLISRSTIFALPPEEVLE